MLARRRAHVHDPVGMANDIELVFHHEQRIARRFQLIERRQQRFGIRGMQSGRRLIQHIDHAEQIGATWVARRKTLQFARRKRRRAAIQREIAQPEVQQHRQPRAKIVARYDA